MLRITGGTHGSWTADYKGETLPVVHLQQVQRWDRDGIGHYAERAKVRSAPGSAPAPHASERWLAHHDMIRQKRKIILQDRDEDSRGTLHRIGYVGVFEVVGEVTWDGTWLRFKFGKPA
jgi:hypothetical protein